MNGRRFGLILVLLALCAAMPAATGGPVPDSAAEAAALDCNDDWYEENDTFDEAAAIEPHLNYEMTFCPGDLDYYTFHLEAGSAFVAEIEYYGFLCDLDVSLYDPSRTLIAWSEGSGDIEHLEVPAVSAAGWYYLRVSGPCSEAVDYRLIWGLDCLDDAYEPNDDFYQARYLNEAGDWPFYEYDLQICEDNEDYFAIFLSQGEVLLVDIFFSHADGDLDLYLYDVGHNLVDSSTSITDNEHVQAPAAPAAGHYFVRVLGYNGAESPFVLVWDHGCDDDYLENNDSFAEASPISAGAYCARICGDDDYFHFPALAGDEIEVKLHFTHLGGDLDLYLYDPAETLLAYSTSITDNELIWLNSAPVTGIYYLRVTGYAGAENSYCMILNTGCTRDAYEDNDDRASAVPIGEGLITGLWTCYSDRDYFTFFAEAGEDLSVDLYFSQDDADLIAHLFYGGVYLLDSSTPEPYGASLTHIDLPYTCWYHLEVVDAYLDDSAGYDLDLDLTCFDDGAEENDTAAEATMLFPGEYLQLRVCAGDDDWFAFFADAGEPLQAEILFSHAAGDLDLYLYDDSLNLLDYSISITDNEVVQSPAAPYTGFYYFEVLGYNGAGNFYDLLLDNGCADDALEENDDLPSATPLAPGYWAPLRICSGDPDVFAFDAVAGDPLRLTLLFSHDAGDLNLYLLDTTGDLLAWSDSTTDGELIELAALPDSGTYFVVVIGAAADQTVYGIALSLGRTLAVDLPCSPASGTLPYPLNLQPALQNTDWFTRTLRGRIDVTIASGNTFANWRTGFTNVAPGGAYSTSFNVNLPALPTLRGDNVFRLVGADVTPFPYNQPPYSPSGHTDSDSCTTTAH